VQTAKNPAQLTEEEYDMINQIILRWGGIDPYITTISPKEFAEKLISFCEVKKKTAFNFLLFNSKKIDSGQIVTPASLNKELAETMLDNANPQDPTDITTSIEYTTRINAYINSSDMTENLQLLALADIYQNIKGKNKVKLQIRKSQKGKPKRSDTAYTKPSGMPSIYKITPRVEKLKVLMSKPKAHDLIRKTLIESGLLYRYEKLIFKSLYYALKKDKSVAHKILRVFISANFVKNPQFDIFIENLCSLDERELDQVAHKAATISIEIHGYDGFLFLGGLLDIISKQRLRLDNLSSQENA
jgi:hypothetical protein